ncbi:MAG: hypothetical protein MJ097_02060 [Dorea sp.]|nr:hypothetical protein [Dorea sp.]
MKLFSTPYYCPKCKEKLNLQWDFDPSKDYWKCVECGTWLVHGDEKDAYKVYKGKKPGDVPVEEAKFDAGDMDDDFYDTPSSTEPGEHGKVNTSIAPFSKDEILEEDQARAEEAIAKYESVMDYEEEDFESADFGEEKKDFEMADFGEEKKDFEMADFREEKEEKEVDPTRKKGWTWPFGKNKKAADPEDHFEEAVIPEEVEVDWKEELQDQKEDAKGQREAKSKRGSSKGKKEDLEGQEEDSKSEKKQAGIVRFFKHLFKHRKLYFIILAIVASLTVGYTIYHHMAKMRTVGLSDEQAGAMTYEEVVKLLEGAGYTNIETIPLEDLQSRNMEKENLVDMISIGGDTDFAESDRFEYDSEIVIQYHSAKMIKMPLDPKKVKEKTVVELENLLKKAGFEKIAVEPDYDLIFGVLHKEGDVKKITVGGSEKFTELQAYRIDTEIVITYHDFKKNNTKK